MSSKCNHPKFAGSGQIMKFEELFFTLHFVLGVITQQYISYYKINLSSPTQLLSFITAYLISFHGNNNNSLVTSKFTFKEC